MSDFNVQNLDNQQKNIYYNGLNVSLGTFWSKNSGMEISYYYELNGELKVPIRMFSTQGGGNQLYTNMLMSNIVDLKHAIDLCMKGQEFPNKGFYNIVFAKNKNGENKTVSVSYMNDNNDSSKKIMFFIGQDGDQQYKVPVRENQWKILYLQLKDLIAAKPWYSNMEHFKEMAMSKINPNSTKFGQMLFLAAQSYSSNYGNNNQNNNYNNNQSNNNSGQQVPSKPANPPTQNNNVQTVTDDDMDDII
jgi:hypothetical protein